MEGDCKTCEENESKKKDYWLNPCSFQRRTTPTSVKTTTTSCIRTAKPCDCDCGRPNMGNRRILGGKLVTAPNKYPWIVFLSISKHDEQKVLQPKSQRCAGSIITNK